jgi:hypothetical protein
MSNREIVEFRIFPSIGVARVGNSPGEFFFGPEVPGSFPKDPDNFRDEHHRIKRQAARFRVYGFDAEGKVVKEITQEDAQITWRVEVANKKSSWFNFDLAMDIPASATVKSTRRNASVEDRASLEITPGPIEIQGRRTNHDGEDSSYAFNGSYRGKSVYLGEVRTDEDGRLIFLGGRGHSENPWAAPAVTFGNNDGFHDDVSDGPIDATVRYKGNDYEARGSWVVVAPPDFAPGIQAIVTGYDLIYDIAGLWDSMATPSFTDDIMPLLLRFSRHQWVNAGFARDFGIGSANDWSDPDVLKRLADKSENEVLLRRSVFDKFRPADYGKPLSNALPAYYGDAMSLDTTSADPRQWMAITPTQYSKLEQWAKGNFVDDFDYDLAVRQSGRGLLFGQFPLPPPRFEDLTPEEQVGGIDRAVLDETLGGPFHPGCEFTWPMRHRMMYSDDDPFRIKRRAKEPDFGNLLTQASALAEGGPLDGSAPGSITRWMAIPWQTDTSSCLSAYIPFIDDYLPTFWPARVPNDVMTEEQYEELGSDELSDLQKQELVSYLRRPKWLRGIRYPRGIAFPQEVNSKLVGVNRFIEKWSEVGIVVEQQALYGYRFWVETGRTLKTDPTESTKAIWAENPLDFVEKD